MLLELSQNYTIIGRIIIFLQFDGLIISQFKILRAFVYDLSKRVEDEAVNDNHETQLAPLLPFSIATEKD